MQCCLWQKAVQSCDISNLARIKIIAYFNCVHFTMAFLLLRFFFLQGSFFSSVFPPCLLTKIALSGNLAADTAIQVWSSSSCIQRGMGGGHKMARCWPQESPNLCMSLNSRRFEVRWPNVFLTTCFFQKKIIRIPLAVQVRLNKILSLHDGGCGWLLQHEGDMQLTLTRSWIWDQFIDKIARKPPSYDFAINILIILLAVIL